MLKTTTSSPRQVLLRLPDELACRLARAVPPRQRNRYIVDLLTKDMADRDRANQQLLADAADQLNAIEAAYPELARETEEWVNAVLTEEEDDGFDPVAFEKGLAIAQAKLASNKKS